MKISHKDGGEPKNYFFLDYSLPIRVLFVYLQNL